MQMQMHEIKTARGPTTMYKQFPFLVVRTQFHGGGVVSRHRFRETAERAARRYESASCSCGCAGVVTLEEYEQLRDCGETVSPYILCK